MPFSDFWSGLSGELPGMPRVGRTVNVAAPVETLARIHQADILVTEAPTAELDARFVLCPCPPNS